MENLPKHLQKYIVKQNYERYTPVDQAVWRYILRQLKSFLAVNAHESYLDGLQKTGIEIEQIPRIENISAALEKIGWRALPVSGFIPPTAFMELQALSVLPIATDMRSLEHLLYTPAPDIVHEAAGHAPMLADPEFAKYLQEYALVASKAIISKEDLNLYEAIRILSDIKENPLSTKQQIAKAEQDLAEASRAISNVSEAAELSRMNWWTAEYGLIGSLECPKIIGAGLLSSKGESKWCLQPSVRKIPLSVDCVKTGYDITEPQPQLYVAKDFQHLISVVKEFSQTMCFRRGGLYGLNKALQAETVNTVQFETGLQISGVLNEYLLANDGSVAYLRFSGPSQVSYLDKELPGHSKTYHADGYGTAIGPIEKIYLNEKLSSLQDSVQKVGSSIRCEFSSGVTVEGKIKSSIEKNALQVLLSLTDCTVKFEARTLFLPEWGIYDMAIANQVTSVFGGPADRVAYGEIRDFKPALVPAVEYSENDKARHHLYGMTRSLRELATSKSVDNLKTDLSSLISKARELNILDWLLLLEWLEICLSHIPNDKLRFDLEAELKEMARTFADKKEVIEDGLKLCKVI